MALMSMSTRKRHRLLASNNYEMPNKYIIDISLHDVDIYGSKYAMFRYLYHLHVRNNIEISMKKTIDILVRTQLGYLWL